jgi:hypothetical protein
MKNQNWIIVPDTQPNKKKRETKKKKNEKKKMKRWASDLHVYIPFFRNMQIKTGNGEMLKQMERDKRKWLRKKYEAKDGIE